LVTYTYCFAGPFNQYNHEVWVGSKLDNIKIVLSCLRNSYSAEYVYPSWSTYKIVTHVYIFQWSSNTNFVS